MCTRCVMSIFLSPEVVAPGAFKVALSCGVRAGAASSSPGQHSDVQLIRSVVAAKEPVQQPVYLHLRFQPTKEEHLGPSFMVPLYYGTTVSGNPREGTPFGVVPHQTLRKSQKLEDSGRMERAEPFGGYPFVIWPAVCIDDWPAVCIDIPPPGVIVQEPDSGQRFTLSPHCQVLAS